jgi:hypothetical protein
VDWEEGVIDGVSGGEEIGELSNCRIVELNSQVKQPIITANETVN